MVRPSISLTPEKAWYDYFFRRWIKTHSSPFIASDYSDILGLDINAKKLDKVRQLDERIKPIHKNR